MSSAPKSPSTRESEADLEREIRHRNLEKVRAQKAIDKLNEANTKLRNDLAAMTAERDELRASGFDYGKAFEMTLGLMSGIVFTDYRVVMMLLERTPTSARVHRKDQWQLMLFNILFMGVAGVIATVRFYMCTDFLPSVITSFGKRPW